ncbi:MAG: MFS transporter [Turicibacter sp.]|nr:MFS transporter [Turicibacter sp.]
MKSLNFRITLFTQIIGLLCSGILNFATALHILDLTGSATIFSTIISISFIPTIIFGPIGGILADRLPKKRLMMIADTIKAILATVLATALLLGRETIFLIGFILTIMITLTTIYFPIVSAIIPSIVNKEDIVKANSAAQSVKALSRFSAPALGGLLFGLIGIHNLVIGVAGLYILSALSNFCLKLPDTDKGFSGGVLQAIGSDLKSGWIYIWKTDAALFDLALTVGIIAMAFFSVLTVAFPYVGRVVLGVSEIQFGAAQAITAISALFGALLANHQKMKPYLQPKYIIHWTFISAIFSLPIGISMLDRWQISNELRFYFFTLGLFLTMTIFTVFNIIKMAAIQRNAPADMVGKATALTMAITILPIPIMQRILGDLLDRVTKGERNLAGIFLVLTSLVFLLGFVKVILRKNEHLQMFPKPRQSK